MGEWFDNGEQLYELTIYLPEDDEDGDVNVVQLVGEPMAMAVSAQVAFAAILGVDDEGIPVLKLISNDVTFMSYLAMLIRSNADVIDISTDKGEA